MTQASAENETQIKHALATVESFENQFHSWLANNEWSSSELIAWLENESLNHNQILMGNIYDPEKDYFQNETSEPCHIIDGAVKKALKADLHLAFTTRIAALLADQPDIKKPGQQPEKVLYNLLILCANDPRPSYFYQPLNQMLHRKALTGTYKWANLGGHFIRAVTRNQSNQCYLAMWEEMIASGLSGFIPDNPDYVRRLALEGILRLPEDTSQPERRMDAIARALRPHILSEEDDVHFSTLSYNYDVPEVCTNSRTFFRDLLAAAKRQNWPDTAILQLQTKAEEEAADTGYGSYPDFAT